MVNSTVALYKFTPHVKDKVEGATAAMHRQVRNSQSDRADDREDPQVQHIDIKEVPRSSTLTR